VQASSLPDINSRQLRAVLAVAEYRSFIAAAAFLKTSQPALTRTIKQIEAVVGASLFSRSTRQVSITQAGKEFAALAERLLNDLKIGIENMRELAARRPASRQSEARYSDRFPLLALNGRGNAPQICRC